MLKFLLTTPEEFAALSPEMQKLYTDNGDGRWTLQVEGAVPKSQLDDFRNTNIALRKQVEAFGDITADEAKELRAKKAEFEAGTDKAKIDKLVEDRVNAVKQTFETEKQTLATERDNLKNKLSERVVDAALIEAGLKSGMRATAQDDLIGRGKKVFRVAADGESIEAVDADGNPLYAPNGDKLNPANWVLQLTKTADHLFDPSSGGGAQGQGNRGQGGQGTGQNPWAKDSWNLTKQGEMIRTNKDQARQFAAAAGVTLEIA
jgi:hypothetical protein